MIRRLIKKVFGKKPAPGPRILPLEAHGIRREQVPSCALRTTRSLREAGYSAFVVGGAVRDLLLGANGEPVSGNGILEIRQNRVRAVLLAGRSVCVCVCWFDGRT